MIKLIGIGLWVCAVTLGSSYVMASIRSGDAEETAEPTYFQGLDYRKTEGMTVPIIAESEIKGYILARFVYTIDGTVLGSLKVPPDPFVLDAAFKAIYSTDGFDFERPERYDLPKLLAGIQTAVNERFGEKVVYEVLVEQFDYIAKNDVRGGQRGGHIVN